jgi:hypothetical protein
MPVTRRGRPTAFPKGFTPSAGLPTQRRIQQARDAQLKAKGYEVVTLRSGISVRVPGAQAREWTRFDRMRSKLTTMHDSSGRVTPRDVRPTAQKEVHELRGWWRKVGRVAAAILHPNTPPHGG